MIAMQNTMHKFVQQPLTHAHGPEWIRGMASIQNATLLEKAHGCIPLLVTYPRAPMLQERRHMLIDALSKSQRTRCVPMQHRCKWWAEKEGNVQ